MTWSSCPSRRSRGGALYLSSNTSANASAVEAALKGTATTTANKSKDGRTITREYVRTF